MTKEEIIYQFWASFDLPAFEENSVPSGERKPKMPYITYEVSTDSFGNDISLNASLWYRSASWAAPDTKADEISRALGIGGMLIPYSEGAAWIKKGSPFSQNMGDESDEMIKRKLLNIEVEFLTM